MLLSILQYGDRVLRERCVPVEKAGAELRVPADNMLETMYAAGGIGLAAPQVGLNIRLIVIDIPAEEQNDNRPGEELISVNGEQKPMRSIMPLIFINPLLEPYGKQESCTEGCLSLRGIHAKVARPARVRAELHLLNGEVLKVDCGGLLARCLQHEYDHLEGTLFTDRVSSAAKVTLARRLRAIIQE